MKFYTGFRSDEPPCVSCIWNCRLLFESSLARPLLSANKPLELKGKIAEKLGGRVYQVFYNFKNFL
jgi:hypothetical protein